VAAAEQARDDGPESTGGRGRRDRSAFASLKAVLSEALADYRSHQRVLPPFVIGFVGTYLLLLLLPGEDADRLTQLVGWLLLQVITPAVVGTALFAYATALFDDAQDQQGSPLSRVVARLGTVGAAAAVSASLSLVLWVLIGSAALLVQPLLFGPPVLLQAIVLERLDLGDAWARTRRVLRRDAMIPAYVLVAVAIVGLVGVVLQGTFAPLTSGLDGDARTAAQLAFWGLVLGLTLPFVAAVGLRAYRLARTP